MPVLFEAILSEQLCPSKLLIPQSGFPTYCRNGRTSALAILITPKPKLSLKNGSGLFKLSAPKHNVPSIDATSASALSLLLRVIVPMINSLITGLLTALAYVSWGKGAPRAIFSLDVS